MPIDMPDKFPVLFDVSQQQLQYDSVKDGIKNVPASGGGSVPSYVSATLASYDSNAEAVIAIGTGKLYKSTTLINGSPVILITV